MTMAVVPSRYGSLPASLDIGPAMGLGAEQIDDQRETHVIPARTKSGKF